MALEVDGKVVLGVITRPRRSMRWWAAAGWGAFSESDGSSTAGRQALAVSTTDSLRGARIGQFAMGASPLAEVLGAAGVRLAGEPDCSDDRVHVMRTNLVATRPRP